MASTFHLFNPENDLALGIGNRNYTPPPHAAALHHAGSLFPMWWAESGDCIAAPEEFEEDASLLRSTFGLEGEIGVRKGIDAMSPWGWSLDAKRQYMSYLTKNGLETQLLPSDSNLEEWRQISHRRTSIKILSELDMDVSLPIETTDPDVVVECERMHPGCFIKSPWSSSGRGVFNASTLDSTTLRKRAAGIINRQGSIIVERGLDKTMDFAALFHSNGDNVKFRGLSLFTALQRGMYAGNIVAPQTQIEHMLSQHLNPEDLYNIISRLENILPRIIGTTYRGWLGVDMMTYMIGGIEKIMPCVELNLRMTMGIAAMKIHEKLSNKNTYLLNWEHNTPIGAGEIELLPPRLGFALRLKPQQ